MQRKDDFCVIVVKVPRSAVPADIRSFMQRKKCTHIMGIEMGRDAKKGIVSVSFKPLFENVADIRLSAITESTCTPNLVSLEIRQHAYLVKTVERKTPL